MDTLAFRERLNTEQVTLEKELASVGRPNAANPKDWEAVPAEVGQEPDPNDRASVLDSYAENDAILTELEIRYQEVLGALSRMDAGTYGVCSVGGEAIEEERLHADPAARTCLAHLSIS